MYGYASVQTAIFWSIDVRFRKMWGAEASGHHPWYAGPSAEDSPHVRGSYDLSTRTHWDFGTSSRKRREPYDRVVKPLDG